MPASKPELHPDLRSELSAGSPLDLGPELRPELRPDLRLRLRLYFGDDLMFGPGKADLLQGIADLGSISAAGRRMAMSYKRAWLLVEEMNAAFKKPLVDSTRGGPSGGGARLTEAGLAVLGHYRALEAIVPLAGAAEIDGIQGLLKDMSDGK